MAPAKNPLTSDPRIWVTVVTLVGIGIESPWFFAGATVLLAGWIGWARFHDQSVSWRWVGVSLILLVLPMVLMHARITPRWLAPDEAQIQALADIADGRVFLSEAQLPSLTRVIQTQDPFSSESDPEGILDGIEFPPYASLTLLNLNLEPIAWRGTCFSNQFDRAIVGQTQWAFSDGRVFLLTLLPIPSLERAQGYLGVEILILSQHEKDASVTWLGAIHDSAADFQAIQVEADQGRILAPLHQALHVRDELPCDYLMLPRLGHSPLLDSLALSWCLLLLLTVLNVWQGCTRRDQLLWTTLCCLILAVGHPSGLDHLTIFASFIFGSEAFGNAFTSPFNLCFSITFASLLARSIFPTVIVPRIVPSAVAFALLVGVVFRVGPFLQKNLSFSIVHPLEATTSAGHFLSALAILLCFCQLVYLMEQLFPKASLARRAWATGIIVAACAIADPVAAISIGSILLVWCVTSLKRWRLTRAILRAGLTVLIFYPSLFLAEQKSEIDYLRTQLLDEITLMNERNHFRISHLLNSLEHLPLGDDVSMEQAMVRLAEDTGLLREDLAFSLQLLHPDGRIVSSIENHMTLLNIPFLLAAQDRIEIYRDKPSATQWMVYRTTRDVLGAPFEFVAVLENDYRNLSLIRNKRWVQTGALARAARPSPYFSYLFDVFDPEGKPVYSEGDPIPLNQLERMTARQKPYFWHQSEGNITFLFNHADFYYRITHKKTPAKMVLARVLSLFLSIWLINLVISPMRSRRHSLLLQWKRSFSLKFASVIFLCSILPTVTLGYFLLNSIKTNQAKEEMAVVKSQISSARNFLETLNQPSQNMGFSDGDSQNAAPPASPRDSLDPPDDQRLAERFLRLSQIMNLDYSVYRSGVLVQTSQPELYREGLLNRRLSFRMARDLVVEHKAHEIHRIPMPAGGYILEAFTPVSLPASRSGVLAIATVPAWYHQRLRWQEQVEFGITAILGILFVLANIVLLIARNFLRPVKAITRSATRMSRGFRHRPIRIDRQDELQRMVSAFNTMQHKIQWSQQELTRQLSLFDVTLQSMNSGLLGCDADGRIILSNAKIIQTLNTTTERLPASLAELVDTYPCLAPLLRILQSGEEEEFSCRLGPSGEEREILVKIRIRDTLTPDDIKTILVFDDITYALASNRLKAWAEMARRVAHEIKNPLTPIQLEIDHLNHVYHSQHPDFAAQLEDGTDQIKKQISHLRQIATEFSDYARPLELHKTSTNPRDVILEVLAPYQRTLKNVTIHVVDVPVPNLLLDQRLFRRAIHNLIENAIQAIDRSGDINVRLFVEQSFLVIWIQDDGPGISEDDQSRVFEAYFSTKDHGTGLGLALARKTVELHGGSLTIDPSFVQGTRFVLKLPLNLRVDDSSDG